MANRRIYIPIHGYVDITPLMQSIIDTPEFQRLRSLKQLGAAHYVFPSATHTRFEHSVGVSHLARRMGKVLQESQPHLKINDRLIELWGIAGLVHDLGHGPYSHLYDDYLIGEDEPKHEKRGIQIFSQMIKKYKLNVTVPEQALIMSMVEPNENEKYKWQFQIVANKLNQIDVDKIDYIQRDCYHVGLKCGGDYTRIIDDVRVKKAEINGKMESILSWPSKINFEIFSLFATRYRLHKQIYNHHTIKAYELLLIPLLTNLMSQEKINPNDLTDDIVLYKAKERTRNVVNFKDKETHEYYKKIVERIEMRYLPKLLEEKVMKYCQTKEKSEKWFRDAESKHGHLSETHQQKKTKTIIGFASEYTPNPLENVYYFDKTLKPGHSKKMSPDSQSFMITTVCKEIILRLYQM